MSAIDFFYCVRNLNRPNNYVQHDKNRIKVEQV